MKPFHFIFLLLYVVQGYAQSFKVHWLEGASIIETDARDKQGIDIYCYKGTTKNILSLWLTIKFNIKIANDEFQQYIANTPENVFKNYKENSYGWNVNPFQHKKNAKIISLDLYNTTCMAITAKERHSIELQIIRIDIWRILLMAAGIVTIFSSKILSGNPLFFYLCGIIFGISASFLIIVHYCSKLLPKKTLTYGILIGGWTVGVYILQQIWENMRDIMNSYQSYFLWYTVLTGSISFLVCYRIGPPVNEQSKNIVMWILQAIGAAMIFFSSEYQEAAVGIIVVAITLKYFPKSLLTSIMSFWHKRFPPRPRLLSSEEYYEEGARETKQALDNLRKYCSSPDCAQWRIMMKLNDSKRFARFVEGDSHLSDSEILDFEAYAFSSDREKKTTHDVDSFTNNMEISDDDSSDSADD